MCLCCWFGIHTRKILMIIPGSGEIHCNEQVHFLHLHIAI